MSLCFVEIRVDILSLKYSDKPYLLCLRHMVTNLWGLERIKILGHGLQVEKQHDGYSEFCCISYNPGS